MHNLHAAYRRMYQALEVQNIEEILPPPPQPQPLDPAVENARALMGEILNTFPDQDHDVHIRIHLMFMKTPLVMTSPQVMGTFYAHLMEHVSQKARQMVMQELQGLVAQLQTLAASGGVDPMAAQAQLMQLQTQMQNPGEIEKLVSLQLAQLVQGVIAELVPTGQDPMSDPLVQIRMQELGLKQQDLQRKTAEDQAQLALEAAKMQQRAATDAARLESQEEIAEDRTAVNRERIEVQRQSAIMRNQNAPQGR
jgi:hypothetical protein